MNGDGVVISTSINDDLSEAILGCFFIDSSSTTISYFNAVISVTSLDINASFERSAAIDYDRVIAISTITVGCKVARIRLEIIYICI